MSKTGFKKIQSSITKNLQGMMSRERLLQGYLNRVVYAQYQKAQRKRWMTEGASEGERWTPLNEAYARWKRVRYASELGGGTKMLIRTNRLQLSVIGGSAEHRKVVGTKRLIISTTVPYAIYVDEKRTFTGLGEATSAEISKGIVRYLATGKGA
jgi:hypothetical protein